MKKGAPEVFFGGLLASADPCEPEYSLSQSHFFADQRFSVSVAFGGRKSHPKGTFWRLFGELFGGIFGCFFRGVF